MRRFRDYTVTDLIDDIQHGGRRYASFYPFFMFHPELVEHFDVAFVHIYGEKQWDIWHPHAAPFLYPEFRIGNNIASLVDFREPDYDRCPLYRLGRRA